MMTGDHAQARNTFRKAIAEHPALALGYVAVAQSYMKDGKDEEALKVLCADAAVPRDLRWNMSSAWFRFSWVNKSRQWKHWKVPRKCNRQSWNHTYQLGLLHMKMQEWKEARAEFDRCLSWTQATHPLITSLAGLTSAWEKSIKLSRRLSRQACLRRRNAKMRSRRNSCASGSLIKTEKFITELLG